MGVCYKLDGARQKSALVSKGTDEEQLRQAEAVLRQTELQISQAEEHLGKFTVSASCDGIVMSRNFTVGDMVSAGSNLTDLSSREERYLIV